MWEAYVMRQDISHPVGWETGRPSEPAFMDLNLHATRDGSLPKASVWQDDGAEPMNPCRLLVAHEEPTIAPGEPLEKHAGLGPTAAPAGSGSVRPVASDLDAFLVGSQGMRFKGAMPAEQLELLHWSLSNVEAILSEPRPQVGTPSTQS